MKRTVRSFSWIALAVVLTLGGSAAPAATPQATAPAVQSRAALDAMSQAFEAAAAKVSPSVVSIFAEKVVQADNQMGMPGDAFRDFFGDQFFRRFFGDPSQGNGQRRTVRGLGSGVIVSPDGLILTNNHVVEKADRLSVVIGDKKSYPAKVIGTDPATDVAVIRIDAKGLPSAALGDSDGVRVGEWVLAIGNPFELMHSVTAGIISAKGRSSVGLADYEDFIQTDASINPGNSGGALADLDGRVVGINTAITAGPSGGSVGIGFAIPINMARKVMDTLIAKGEVVRGFLGVTLQPIDENMAQALELKGTDGALVGDVVAGGPADKAGIERGDVVLSVDGKTVRDSIEVRNLVADGRPGQAMTLGLLRDGKRLDRKVVLGERPKERNGEESGGERQAGSSRQKLGLAVRDLTPEIAQPLGYRNEKGAVVAEVVPGSPADDAGLQPGDLVQEVNRVPVRSARDLERIAHGLRSGDAIALLVRRGDGTLFLSLKVL